MGVSVSVGLFTVLSISKNQTSTLSKKCCTQESCSKYLVEHTDPFCSGCGSKVQEYKYTVPVDEDFFLKIKDNDMEDEYCGLNLIASNDENDEDSLLIYNYESQVKRESNCYNVLSFGSYTMKLPSQNEQDIAIEDFKTKNAVFLKLLESQNISYDLNVQVVGDC